MRRLDDPEQRESVYDIITHNHMATDEEKMEEKDEVGNMSEDEFMSEEEDMVENVQLMLLA